MNQYSLQTHYLSKPSCQVASSEEIVDVDEAYPQEKSEKTTKVSDEAVVVVCELLCLDDNLALGHSLKLMRIWRSLMSVSWYKK